MVFLQPDTACLLATLVLYVKLPYKEGAKHCVLSGTDFLISIAVAIMSFASTYWCMLL